MQIGIVGLGNFGTALADYLASLSSCRVLAWAREEEIVLSVNKFHKNPLYLNEYSLNSNLKATNKLKDLEDCDILLLMLPALALKEILPKIKVKKTCSIISCAKGLAGENKTPLTIIHEEFKLEEQTFVLSGPGFAKDIISKKPIGLTLAGNEEKAKDIANLFSSKTMRIYTSSDKLGVELGGILKNVIAIVAGISDSLSFGDSARAGLLTRGLAEIIRFGVSLGAKKETFVGLSGLGDLVLTATSDKSRNRQFGLALGEGLDVKASLEKIGSTVEGVKSAPKILKIAKENNIEMPLTEAVVGVIEARENINNIFENLISRPIKTEIE